MGKLDDLLGIENGMVIAGAATNWGCDDGWTDDWDDPDPYDDRYDFGEKF